MSQSPTITTPAPATSGSSSEDITELWGVTVWLGHLQQAQIGPVLPAGAVSDAHALPFVPAVQRSAIAACAVNEITQWSWDCKISTWRSGHFVGAQHTAGDVRVLVILGSDIDEEHPDSGCLSVHDPREGAGNVALPGLPWGRPLKIPGRTGLALAVPGWMRWSLSPLRAPHQMTVWTGIASRLPTTEGR